LKVYICIENPDPPAKPEDYTFKLIHKAFDSKEKAMDWLHKHNVSSDAHEYFKKKLSMKFQHLEIDLE
jgi:hypothetical protein